MNPSFHKNSKLTFIPVDFYIFYVYLLCVFFECGLLACDAVKVEKYVFPSIFAIYHIHAVMLPKTLVLMPHALSTAL